MIRLKDVEKTYENGTEALQGISFTIEDGEFVFLVGPSGSGKSTIIKLLTGEVIPTAGRVMVNGFSMSRISDRQIPYMRPGHHRGGGDPRAGSGEPLRQAGHHDRSRAGQRRRRGNV